MTAKPSQNNTYRTVWKYTMTWPSESFDMPADAQVINVETQHGNPTLWAVGTAGERTEKRTFECYGTGHPIPDYDTARYVGTAHGIEGGLVFHIFERVG